MWKAGSAYKAGMKVTPGKESGWSKAVGKMHSWGMSAVPSKHMKKR
jgi:hypothetical protein